MTMRRQIAEMQWAAIVSPKPVIVERVKRRRVVVPRPTVSQAALDRWHADLEAINRELDQ